MYKILGLYSREVLDSRWNPTVEVDIIVANNERWFAKWRAIVPSWASTGVHEAIELRDWDPKRYWWKWVLKAVENVNKIIKDAILNKDFESFRELDKFLIDLDWTENKSNLWANAMLWVSMAFVVACANSEWTRLYDFISNGHARVLPYPMMNILNWWSHADNSLDIQEFMIVPIGATNFHEAVRMWSEVFHSLKTILKEKKYSTGVWDEWWYAPNLSSNEEALDLIVDAINKAWYDTNKIKLALDVAASEFYKDWKYIMKWEWKIFNSEELIKFYESMISKYPIISIEDGLSEDDFDWWKILQEKLWKKIMIVWDDLLVTNISRLKMAIDKKLCNSILIKLNQIGTVSETIDAVNLAHEYDMKAIISHRSGETEDTFIADFSVAMNTWFIKTWSLSRTDRIAKYNQIMRIEDRLEGKWRYGE